MRAGLARVRALVLASITLVAGPVGAEDGPRQQPRHTPHDRVPAPTPDPAPDSARDPEPTPDASTDVAGQRSADAPRQVPGETIVVSGLRLPRPVRDVPALVTVMEREEIERSPLRLADEILRTIPSVGTFRRSSSAIADPTSQGVNLRGAGPSAVSRGLVLRDGVPVNDPFGGWVYWRAMSPLGIERIEVSPSGASALFGDFALGGVVQIFSMPIAERRAQVLASGGSYGTGRAAARVTDRFGELGVAIDGEVFHSEGYTPIAPEQRGPIDEAATSTHGNLGARLEHVRGPSTTHLAVRWFRESLDAGTRHTTADVRTLTLGAGWKLTRDSGTLDVQVFGGDHEFRQHRARVTPDRSDASLASRQRTPSANQGAFVTYTTQLGERHAIVMGIDGRRVAGTATDVLSPPMIEADTLLERAAGGEQRFLGVFAEDLVHVTDDIDVVAAIRVDGWQSRDGELALEHGSGERVVQELAGTSDVEVNPRIGILGRITPELALRASGYRAFRAPTLNELYRPFQVGTVLTAANEMLGPEILWGAEAGPQVVVSNIVVRATGFYNHLEDAIGNVTLSEPREDGASRQRQNFGTARIAGVELEASWRPTAAWTFLAAHAFMHATVVDGPAESMLVGKRLAQVPRQRATGSVTFDDASIATITAQVRYLGRQFEDDLNTLPIGAALLVDARVARAIGRRLAVFVAAENLFDRRYLVGRAGVDTLGTPRTFELGIVLDTH